MTAMLNQSLLEVAITIHAAQRAIARGITEDQISETIKKGNRFEVAQVGERGGKVYRFERKFLNRPVVVMAEVVGVKCHAISTWYA